MEPRTLLKAHGLRKAFGEGAGRVQAVDGVSFRLQEGEVVMVMGPSGSGKSTLLAMLGLLLRPDEGQVRFMGRDVTGLSERERARLRRRHVGFVFQDARLLPFLPAVENVALAARLAGADRREARRRAEALLGELGLGDRLRSWPRNLSGGERQRVALARSLAGHPALVLADEPTGNLDSRSGRQVVSLLRGVARRHRVGIVIVSHDARVCPYTDLMHILEDGQIVRQEKPPTPAR